MSPLSLSTPSQAPHHLRAPVKEFDRPAPTGDQVADAKKLQKAFTQFVGATVFGQMLSSMRSTVGEPAYFHGGRAEEMFQSQLDQAMADEMTAGGGSPFAKSLFEHQFPAAAQTLKDAGAQAVPKDQALAFEQLNALPRR